MKTHWTLRLVVRALVVGLFVWVVPAATATDEGQAAAEQVSLASYQNFMNNYLYTHVGQSRGPNGAQHDPARNNIKALFESFGLPTVYETFTYGGQTWENIVATKVGTTYPSRIYIIGAHYDSVNAGPGADDNASGTAAVLEIARILSQYDSESTIRFIAFDMEEQGLIGSSEYVADHQSEDIRRMISLDMVAYDTGTNNCNIYGRTASNPIKNELAAAVAEYSGGLTYTIGGDTPYSDHAPFEEAGFQACLLIEYLVWSNPYYHTAQDSYEQPGNLNFPYAVKMTRAVCGWLVDAAGVQVPVSGLDFAYPEGLPELSSPAGGTTVRVQITGEGGVTLVPGTAQLLTNVGAGWVASPLTQVGADLFEGELPAAGCGSTVAYYFSAQGSDGRTFTDPYSAPAEAYETLAAYGVEVFYENLFDTNPGWAVQTQWAFGHPTGGGSHSHDPTNGHTGTNVYGYNLLGDYANNLPAKYLTTPPFDCTGKHGVSLEFWRWLGVESNNDYDEATIEISLNGTNWTVFWRATDTGAAIDDSAWTLQTYDISSWADNQPAVRIRWGMGPTDSYLTYPGWNIDDVRLTALVCEAPFLVGDVNCDGNVGFADINPFVLALTNLPAYEAAYPGCPLEHRDINANGTFGFDDLNPFVALLTGP